MVASFLSLGNRRIATRYCHLNPRVDFDTLMRVLTYQPQFFPWAGSDLFNVANGEGKRQMVVIETNSCPSGQKSMPWPQEEDSGAGYTTLLAATFIRLMEARKNELPAGGLAVIFDKNPMEASGYAAKLAELTDEPVYLVEFYEDDPDPPVCWRDGVCFVRNSKDVWVAIRAAFRYVTQKPWTRFPLLTKTMIINPVMACLAGGRNKAVAAKAYEVFNHLAAEKGINLQIRTPETIKDVSKAELPLWLKSFGGHAVIKVPYSNAGQGVYTITNDQEMEAFMSEKHTYDKFIIQSLIGNSKWSSVTREGQFYHVGTVPNKRNETYVADLRMMIGSGEEGYAPICVYARRAHNALVDQLTAGLDSWSMLGTNLSVKQSAGGWGTETNRLLLMDRKDFNQLGLGIDDLIDGYVQTVLAAVAIDRMCKRFIVEGKFNMALFSSLNDDKVLLQELMTSDSSPNINGFPPSSSSSSSSPSESATNFSTTPSSC